MAEANPQDFIHPEREELAPEIHSNIIEHIQNPFAQRSAKQVIIFLYGKSGSGKSSTLNHLFDSNVIPTKNWRSETRKVTEYGCSLEESLFREKLAIRFIDSPGFDDTEGEDADNLARISYFIGNHPELKNSEKLIYPNIVLVVISASNKRLSGIYSSFSRMLHVLSELNVVDRLHPNVVIAVTHAMHFTRANYIEETKYIKDVCRIMTRAHFSLEVPVIFIENMDERNELEHEGDWRILPDGKRQSLNLFDAMITLMEKSGDKIGSRVVKHIFSESKKYKFIEIENTSGNPNVDKLSSNYWEQILEEKFFSKKKNENYRVLSSYVGSGTSDNIGIFPLIYNLQKIKLVKPDDFINLTLEDILQRLKHYQLTEEENSWLIHIFNVPRIHIKLDFELLGLGYSEKMDKKLNRILEIGPVKTINIGKYVMDAPETCSVNVVREVFFHSSNVEKKLQSDLVMTFQINYVLFKVSIDEPQKGSIDPVFINELKKEISKDTGNRKHNSLKIFPSHCIIKLDFGGLIEGKLCYPLQLDKQNSLEFQRKKIQEITAQIKTWIANIDRGNNPCGDIGFDEKISSELKNCKIKWKGGDKKYHSRTFIDINVNNWQKWTNSIPLNIICLDRMVEYVPLFDILSNSHDEEIRSYAEVLNTTNEAISEDFILRSKYSINMGCDSNNQAQVIMTRNEAGNAKSCVLF